MFNWSESRFLGTMLAAAAAYLFVVDWTCRRLAAVSAELRSPLD